MTEFIRIDGAKELEAVLKQLPDYIAKNVVRQALRKAAVPILEEARRTAPVGTESKGRTRLRTTKKGKVTVANYGKLRGELKIITVPDSKTQASAAVAVTVGKAYWGVFQEFGTSRMPNPRHKGWFRRAFDSKARAALDVLGKELGAGIEKAAVKLAGPLKRSGLRTR